MKKLLLFMAVVFAAGSALAQFGNLDKSNPFSEYNRIDGSLNPNNPFSELNRIGGSLNPNNPFNELNRIGGSLNPNNPFRQGELPRIVPLPNGGHMIVLPDGRIVRN